MPEESRKSTAFAPVPQQSDLGDPKVFSTVLGVSMRSLFKALAEGRENEVPELVFSMTALLLDPSAFIQPQGWSASALAERFRSVLDDQLPDLSADLEHPAEAVALMVNVFFHAAVERLEGWTRLERGGEAIDDALLDDFFKSEAAEVFIRDWSDWFLGRRSEVPK